MRGNGSCRAGVPGSALPFGVNTCKVYDLGYDHMRWFGSSGARGRTRRSVDNLFLSDMTADCRGQGWFRSLEGPCRTVANLYFGAVSFKSARQGFGVP